MTASSGPIIGFVVIGRNEGERLIRCLNSLPHDAGKIVYVDSGSTDDSVANANSRGVIVHALDMARPFTAARARNEGVSALVEAVPSIERIQFLDGDCELESGWLDTASKFLDNHPDVAVVCGRRRERFPEQTIYNLLCDIEWNTRVGEIEACGGDALMRSRAFLDVGGYNPALIAGEEPEMCARLRGERWKIWRLDAPMTIHDAAMTTFRQWWLRTKRGGFAYAQTAWVSRGRATRPFGHALHRALFWGLVFPLAALFVALWYPIAVPVALAIYALRFFRIWKRNGIAGKNSAVYPAFIILSPFAEVGGALEFCRRAMFSQPNHPIFYK